MSRLPWMLALLTAACGVKEVDDLIDDIDDDDAAETDTEDVGCPEQDLGSALGPAVAQGQTTRQGMQYRVCGGTGDSGGWGSGGWGSSGGGTGGGWSEGSGGSPPPDGPDDGGHPGVSFRWTAPSSGTFVFDTCGSRFDTMLGIRPDDCSGDTLECNDDWHFLQSQVSVSADAGDVYVVVLTGYSGDVGAYTLSIGEGATAGACEGDTGWGWGTTSTTWYGTDTGWTSELPEVGVEWGDAAMDVFIVGGPGAYWLGMAETEDCDDCWTGEDCVYGYESEGTVLSWCHDIGDGGGSLTYGGDRAALVPGSTAFEDATAGSRVSYILESDPEFGGDGSCHVWGADPTYYDGLGCISL